MIIINLGWLHRNLCNSTVDTSNIVTISISRFDNICAPTQSSIDRNAPFDFASCVKGGTRARLSAVRVGLRQFNVAQDCDRDLIQKKCKSFNFI